MSTPRMLDVKIVTETNGNYLVKPVWADVDRPETGGYSCGKNLSLAARLQHAMEEGAVFDDVEIITDVNDKTFVSAALTIRMRCANADLATLGY